MKRAVFAPAWPHRHRCYHPSLPPRKLRMVEDLAALRATVLIWPSLGGGSISLPYLEEEANAKIDARFRFYGFVNDREFIAHCQSKGIKVFGVVFTAQGWEFPVELNEEEDTILAFNELRGVGKRAELGLREFTQNRFPKLWAPFERYFPEGLTNSDGERVTDLFEECTTRTLEGKPCRAAWVECKDRAHRCHLMDPNNPVWRRYLEAIVRIQIDAGVDGIQFDELLTPISAMPYGGCFCKDCGRGFREFLQLLPPEARPTVLAEVDLDRFDYAAWLRGHGYDDATPLDSLPLFDFYLQYQTLAVTKHFHELADATRRYARQKGRSILVTGNLFDVWPVYTGIVPGMDLLAAEMRNTEYAQPAWHRYAAAFAEHRPMIVAVNPYGGIIPELVADLERGRSRDRLRVLLYEGAAMGTTVAVPYGSWMGSEIDNAFYAPHDLAVETQAFLADHDRLIRRDTLNEVGLLYSVATNIMQVAARESGPNAYPNPLPKGLVRMAYDQAAGSLVESRHPFDVVFLHEGFLRQDPPDLVERMLRYETLVAPGCGVLSDDQLTALEAYLERGGSLVVCPPFADSGDDTLRIGALAHAWSMGSVGSEVRIAERILAHARTVVLDGYEVGELLQARAQVRFGENVAVFPNVQRTEDGSAALHLLHYGYDAASDRAPTLTNLDLAVRLRDRKTRARLFVPGEEPRDLPLGGAGNVHELTIPELHLYAIVELT